MAFQDIDLAYAAGIMDGEGCVGITRYKTKAGYWRYTVRVCVEMTDPEAPVWLAATLGGTVSFSKKTKSGKVIFRWELAARKAVSVLEAILPFVKIKKTRMVAAIQLNHMQQGHGGRPKRGFVSCALMPEEIKKRDDLALVIRKENLKSRASVATSSWGVN